MSSQTFYPLPAKLIFFALASDQEWLALAKQELVALFGPIEQESKVYLYQATKYYSEEMGKSILRQFLSFQQCVGAETLADLKIQTNHLEAKLSEQGKRRANLDCGLLSFDKIVIASTKPANYRVYLRDGIYAQATYWFEKGTFHAWPWTYDEYKSSDIITFFNSVRNKLGKNNG